MSERIMLDCKLRIARSEFRRSFRQFVIAFAVIAASAIPSFAGETTTPTYSQALDALYNLDFSDAEHAFSSLVGEDPPNPDYWNGLASTIWMKILYDQRKFNIDSYSGSSIGTTRSHDSVNPDDEKRLRDAIGIAMTRANAMLMKNPKDVRALYAIGVSNATLAAFEGISKRSYLTALSRAKAARRYHEKVLSIDANFSDALLSIGTYDYGASVIPLPFRFALLGMFGASGSGKDEGIRKLEIVASSGSRASTDAKMILIAIYNREGRYDQSLQFIDELLAKYPRNFQFEMDRAAVYGRMKNWSQAVSAYQHILSKVQTKQDGYDRLRAERVYAQIGRANVNQLKLDEAIAAFNEIVGSGKAADDEKADAHLRIGKIYDSRSERDKATQEYDAILKLNCSKPYQNDAKGYLSKPFKD